MYIKQESSTACFFTSRVKLSGKSDILYKCTSPKYISIKFLSRQRFSPFEKTIDTRRCNTLMLFIQIIINRIFIKQLLLKSSYFLDVYSVIYPIVFINGIRLYVIKYHRQFVIHQLYFRSIFHSKSILRTFQICRELLRIEHLFGFRGDLTIENFSVSSLVKSIFRSIYRLFLHIFLFLQYRLASYLIV